MSRSGGTEYLVERIVEESLRSRPMFFGGGGVTFTGGEATLQAEELLAALRALRREGIHTALETNGSSPWLPEIAREVDYLMMDFKHYDAEAFRHYTGVSIDGLKGNFEILSASGRQLHVRIPLIRHVNAEDPRGFAEYFSAHPSEGCVFEFLPYHEYGKKKWTEEYTVKDGFITPEQLRGFRETFADYGLSVIET
jgi:pyruvate formate lyase activating enzyme